MSIKALFRSIQRQWFSGSSKENGNTFVQQGASVCSNCGLELLGGPDGVPAKIASHVLNAGSVQGRLES
jgi:hypothetical protein